jgi:hypothetical protein
MKSLSGTLPLLLFLTCLASPLDAARAQTGGLGIVGARGGPAPVVTKATYSDARSRLKISGGGVGTAGAQVFVNGNDVSARITKQGASKILLVGTPSELGLRAGPNDVAVVVNGAASNTFVLLR